MPLDATALILVALLAAMAVCTTAYALVTTIHRQRRDTASLKAIGFVRSTVASRLDRSVPLNESLLQMAESLKDTLTVDAVEIWMASAGALDRAVSEPDRGPARLTLSRSEESIVAHAPVSGAPWARVWLPGLVEGRERKTLRIAPIQHSGQLLGLIVVEHRAEGSHLGPEADDTLKELAREVGVAINNTRLDSALEASLDELRRQAEALQASRARIVAAADAERRRIERDLHDGAQQYLVALAVKVRLARQLLEREPARSAAIMEELVNDIQKANEELRTLAHGIYPPLLASDGLGPALTASARRAPLPTEVQANGTGRYPAQLEAAAYFCCLEALQNAGKYAGEGARATIRIWEEAGGLLFEVADDGAGFDAENRPAGSGFTNMTDRLGAVGGSLRVDSAPGRGTTISGVIPLGDIEGGYHAGTVGLASQEAARKRT